jgi:hypothetical protein
MQTIVSTHWLARDVYLVAHLVEARALQMRAAP